MGWPLKVRGTFQRSPFKFRAAAKSVDFFPFHSVHLLEGQRKEGRFSHLVTCATLIFADQIFADGH